MKKLLIAIALMASAQASAITVNDFFQLNGDARIGYAVAVYDMTVANASLEESYRQCVESMEVDDYAKLIASGLSDEKKQKDLGWLNMSTFISFELNQHCYGNKSPQ